MANAYSPISNPLMQILSVEWDLHHNTRVLGAILCLSSVLMAETKNHVSYEDEYLFKKIIDFFYQILKKIICYEQEYMTKTHLSYLYNRNWLREKKSEIKKILEIEHKKYTEWVKVKSTLERLKQIAVDEMQDINDEIAKIEESVVS